MPGQAVVTLREKQWQVSLATTYAELVGGLSGVPSILAGTGMLFVLPADQLASVTTQLLLFNIDIIFISSGLEVVDVARNVAPGTIVTENTPVRYFLEVNAGEADDIESGDIVGITIYQPASTVTNWISPLVSFAGFMAVGAFMVSTMRNITSAILGEAKRPEEPKLLPQTGGKPTREDVTVDSWVERDRIGIWVTDMNTGETVAEWWDDEAREMFKNGFFEEADYIRGQKLIGKRFEDSVKGYLEDTGVLAKTGLQPQPERELVRVTRPSDSWFRPGQIVTKQEFERAIAWVKEQGGEPPLGEPVKGEPTEKLKLLPQASQEITREEWQYAKGMWEVTKEDAEKGEVAGVYLWSLVTKYYPDDKDKQIRLMGFMNQVLEKYPDGRVPQEEARALAKKWDVEKVLVKEMMEFLPQLVKGRTVSNLTERKPRGTCYEDAWRFLMREEEGHLIHGTVLSDSKRIGHAWVETLTGYIWEPETKEFYTHEAFQKSANPLEENRYTVEQVAIMASRTHNLGPWTEEERRFLKEKSSGVKPSEYLPQVSTETRLDGLQIVKAYKEISRHGEDKICVRLEAWAIFPRGRRPHFISMYRSGDIYVIQPLYAHVAEWVRVPVVKVEAWIKSLPVRHFEPMAVAPELQAEAERLAREVDKPIAIIPLPSKESVAKVIPQTSKTLAAFMEMAEWYCKHQRPMTVKELRPIATKYFGTDDQLIEFYEYLASPQGQKEFRRELRDAMRRHGISIPPEAEWLPLALDALPRPAIIPVEKHPGRETDLEYLADSPEFLTQTIDITGYRSKLDNAFQEAIARVKGLK